MLIYIDTNIWIYAFENHPVFGEAARDVFARLRAGQHQLAVSLFLAGELQVTPVRSGNQFALASYQALFRSREVVMLPYKSEAVSTYVSLRAQYRVKGMDALHLATAALGGVDLFMTEDARLRSFAVPGIGRIAGIGSLG